MKIVSTTSTVLPPTNMGAVGKAWDEVSASFDRFCLAAGVEALGAMMEKDAEEGVRNWHCGAGTERSRRTGSASGR
jgi:putative transposase